MPVEPTAGVGPLELPRRNWLEAHAEHFRPPSLGAPLGLRGWALAKVRRLLDPAANAIWRDLSVLLPQAQGTFLDVGCGAQPYRSLVSAAARYLAIDQADAQAHFGYQAPDTTYFSGERWPMEDASVDWVLSTEVLEHVATPAAFMAQARRCLKPGGRLVLTAAFSARWHFIPHDFQRFTPSGLRLLLQEAGFTDLRVYALGNPLTVACHKCMALVFPLLLSRARGWRRWTGMLVGFLFAPVAVLAALIAASTLGLQFGDDTLGYTVTARAPFHAPS